TGEWHYSAIRAGLAIAPGPLMVLPFARLAAPLAARLGGPGRVAVIGCLVNAAGMLLWLARIQPDPAYLTHLLPSQLIGGAGVGLSIPSLLGAGSAALPPARFGTGSGILNMGRQIGTVLGVAALIAILSRTNPADPLAGFRHGVLLTVALFAGAAAVAAALLTVRSPVRAAAVDPSSARLTEQQRHPARE
ncbi:MAG TPA: MFS transporter, partial [Streptosporangiaceae bacterium]